MKWMNSRLITVFTIALATGWSANGLAASDPGGSTVGMARIVRKVQVVSEKILFVTDRKRTGLKALSEQFSGERSDTPSFGVAHVAVAASSEDDSSYGPETQAVKILPWADILGKLSKTPRVLVVTHGFNKTFDEALAMAALLKRNLRSQATILMVSWPSLGSPFRYFADEEAAPLSSRMMASTLTEIARMPSAPILQIFAHSLGSRLTVMSLRRIFDSSDRDVLGRISQLVLAAPDIDRELMDLEFIPVLEKFRIPTTVYGSEKDVWIGFSEFLHVRSRVGSFWNPSVYLRSLLTSVDLSRIENGSHSVAFSPAVIYDLYFVLERELPPEQRPWLWKIQLAAGTYWQLVPMLIR